MKQYVVYFHCTWADGRQDWAWSLVWAKNEEQAWEKARAEYGDNAYNVVWWNPR